MDKRERKGKITGVRLKDNERELVERAAASQNQGLSKWIRDTLLESATKQTRA